MDNTIPKIAVSPVQISEESSKPQITKRGVAIVIAIWCLYSLYTAIPPVLSFQVPFLTSLFWQTIQSAVKMMLSVPVWFIVIRWMHEKRWYWKGLAHCFLGPIYVGLNFGYQYYVAVWFGSRVHAEPLLLNPGWTLFFDLFIYIMQFTLYHSYEILRKLRIREKIALELLTLQKERELAILKSQVNPHFLFNTLNSISAMASTDAEETRTMIAQLGDLLRYVIEGTKNDLVPLQKELQFVKDYVDLESKRMGDRLTTEFHVDQSLATFPVPPMTLQPLIENAIKHGITPLEKGVRVTVQIQKSKDAVAFRVSDTGVGVASTDPLSTVSGTGLKNTDARLRMIYGDAARLKISSLKNSGYEVTFSLPAK
jgi:two-component system LytT family sensor kinase